MENIIIIVLVIWVLLNIILFFKIWNATSNIELIVNFITRQEISKSPRLLYATNRMEEVYSQLNIQLFSELHLLAIQCAKRYNDIESDSQFNKGREEVISNYQKSYKMINKEIPKHFKEATLQQMQEIKFLTTDYGV